MAKVLIADDATFMRMILRDILSDADYEIIAEVDNGQDAVHKYLEFSPDIVTMDITMPKLDGISALKEIMKKNPKARVIMCSAMGQQALVIEAIQAGAKDFIIKPFQPERVLDAVKRALST